MPPRATSGRARPSRGHGRGRGTSSDDASVVSTSPAGGALRGRGRGIASDVSSVQSTSSATRGRGRGAASVQSTGTAGGATREGPVAIAGEYDSDHLRCSSYVHDLNISLILNYYIWFDRLRSQITFVL